MVFPNRRKERKLHRAGFKLIAGLDEAGRGAWAGPLVAAVVILDPKKKIRGIRDSKKLRSPDRKLVYNTIIAQATAWAVGVVSPKEIDTLGLQPANALAFQRATDNLELTPEHLLVDGNFFKHPTIPTTTVIDGDHKVRSIAAASIVAKVTRDELMDRLDERYPAYGFKHHKGYGTEHHHHMLMKYGVCDIHRKTFEPISFIEQIKH